MYLTCQSDAPRPLAAWQTSAISARTASTRLSLYWPMRQSSSLNVCFSVESCASPRFRRSFATRSSSRSSCAAVSSGSERMPLSESVPSTSEPSSSSSSSRAASALGGGGRRGFDAAAAFSLLAAFVDGGFVDGGFVDGAGAAAGFFSGVALICSPSAAICASSSFFASSLDARPRSRRASSRSDDSSASSASSSAWSAAVARADLLISSSRRHSTTSAASGWVLVDGIFALVSWMLGGIA